MRRIFEVILTSALATLIYMYAWLWGMQVGSSLLPDVPAWFLSNSSRGHRLIAWMEIQAGTGVLAISVAFAVVLVLALKSRAIAVSCLVAASMVALILRLDLIAGQIPHLPLEANELISQSSRIAIAKTLFLPAAVLLIWRLRKLPFVAKQAA